MFKFQCWALFVFSIFAVIGIATDTSDFDSASAIGLVYALMVIGVTAYVLFVHLKDMAEMKKDNASLQKALAYEQEHNAVALGTIISFQRDDMHASVESSSPVKLPSVKTRAPKKGKK